LAARYGGDKTQLGGKGTQRRTQKVKVTHQVQEDGKLKSAVKKFGVQNLPDIEEVNMFKDDNSIVNFRKPLIQFSVRENLLIVTGEPQTKQLKDLMPEIMKQVGPQQYEALKTLVGDYAKQSGAAGVAADDEDDVPPLVAGTFEDAAGKK